MIFYFCQAMRRHHKQIRKFLHDESSKLSFILVVVLIVTMTLQIVVWQETFIWIDIDPISVDWFFSRLAYSALTFVTLGSLLYRLWFYKVLYVIFGKLFGYTFYKDLKKIVRIGLIALMYFIIVPFVADILNTILTRWYNCIRYIGFITPALWVWLMLFVIIVLLHFHHKKSS